MNKRTVFGTLAVITLVLATCGTSGSTKDAAGQPNRAAAPAPEKPVVPGFVQINGGTFTMGSPADERERGRDEGPQHQVTVSAFSMGKYPVTQKEYQEIMGTNPSNETGEISRPTYSYGGGPGGGNSRINDSSRVSDSSGINLPVVMVSWFDAIEYCNRLSQKEGLTPAYTVSGWGDNRTVNWNRSANGYRLPTEAEWEYACRAGTTTPFSTGYNITTSQANYDGTEPYNYNARGENREKLTPVDRFEPNPWGLYDMHGNVYEWCWDWYGDYPRVAQTDPTGPSSGPRHVIRGGSFLSQGWQLRSALRAGIAIDRANTVGFRIVRP